MPISPRISPKSYTQNHQDMHQTMCQKPPRYTSSMCQNSKICLKAYTKTSKICLKAYAKTSKICLKAYTKTSKIQASRHIEKHTFHHAKTLMHEISDHQTFFNFNINKRASSSNLSSTSRDWTGQRAGPRVMSIGQPVGASWDTLYLTRGGHLR
jgi:hypothetical protein